MELTLFILFWGAIALYYFVRNKTAENLDFKENKATEYYKTHPRIIGPIDNDQTTQTIRKGPPDTSKEYIEYIN